MEEKINTHLANDLEQSAAMLDSREFDAVQLDNCASMMRYAATVIHNLKHANRELLDTLRQALAQLEDFEVSIDSEWGECRSIEELYRDTESPPSALSRALRPATIQTRAMLNKHKETHDQDTD